MSKIYTLYEQSLKEKMYGEMRLGIYMAGWHLDTKLQQYLLKELFPEEARLYSCSNSYLSLLCLKMRFSCHFGSHRLYLLWCLCEVTVNTPSEIHNAQETVFCSCSVPVYTCSALSYTEHTPLKHAHTLLDARTGHPHSHLFLTMTCFLSK